jgi:hypothetical protein
MATILGSCGCGCGGGGCEKVTTNCNFVLRKYDTNATPSISWNGDATSEMRACFESNGTSEDCYQIGIGQMSFTSTFSPCTGEGEIYLNTGGGSDICSIETDEGPLIVTVPCCSSPDLYECSTTFYNIYDAGSNSGELYGGSFKFNGVPYTVLAGILQEPEEPPPTSGDPEVLMSSSQGISSMSSGTLLGTYTSTYEDESIDFDNIGEVELTDDEKTQPSDPCKFSYNFSFTPEEGADYYVMSSPCSDTQSYLEVNLEQDGRAYFISSYNETTKLCSITQTFIVAPDTDTPDTDTPDTNVPESQ